MPGPRQWSSRLGVGALVFSLFVIVLASLYWQPRRTTRYENIVTLSTVHNKQATFLFIGVLSSSDNWRRRAACRKAWADAAQVTNVVTTRFFVTGGAGAVIPNITDDAHDQENVRDDIVPVPGAHSYQTIGLVTWEMFQHANKFYDYSFVLKTDDDSFVNVPALLVFLRKTCSTLECKRERIYMGFEVDGISVERHPTHKHQNEAFYQHTHLETYPKYMVGGGYILSSDIVRWLLQTHNTIGITIFTAIEDAELGFYISSWNLRRIHSTRFWTIEDPPCCFNNPDELTLNERATEALCTENQPLIAHKMSAEQMEYLGERVRNC